MTFRPKFHHEALNHAYHFARIAHAAVGQNRKYTGDPYIVHPVEVMEIVRTVAPDDVPLLQATLLHDVIEDTRITFAMLSDEFGFEVASLVDQVTDKSRPEHGNREARKEIDRRNLAWATPRAKTLKLADLIANTRSIVAHDAGFAAVYLREKELLLPVLTEGDRGLYLQAQSVLTSALDHINRIKDSQ